MPLCRLSIQADTEETSATVDVALPTTTSVAVLLPTVVALAVGEPTTAGEARQWRLQRSCGLPIDESMTLTGNDVRDGDLLVLTADGARRPAHSAWDASRTVSTASLPDTAPFVTEAVCTWSVIVAMVLAGTGIATDRLAHLAVAVVATAAIAFVASRRPALSMAAVAMTAATGFLAVPAGPAAANVFLAAVSAGSMSILLMWWADRPSMSLTAAATFSVCVAVAAVGPIVGSVPLATAGATLGTASLGALAVAARVAVMVSGLAPGSDSAGVAAVAARGHAVLSGMVAGCSCGVMAGCVLVAVACQRGDAAPAPGGVFTGALALVLLLRVRTHVDFARRAALTAGGLLTASVALGIAAWASPTQAAWWSAAAIGAGLATVTVHQPGAIAARAVDVAEYAALAAVIPLACWVCGVYALARGWHLP